MDGKIPYQILMSERLHEELKGYAKSVECPAASVVRMALVEFLNHKHQLKGRENEVQS